MVLQQPGVVGYKQFQKYVEYLSSQNWFIILLLNSVPLLV